MMESAALLLRKHVAEFGDDLRQEDVKKLMFLRQIPRGIQERLPNPVDVFGYLEEIATLDFQNPQTVVEMMRDINKEKWALDTEKMFCNDEVCTEEQDGVNHLTVVTRREQPSAVIRHSNSLKRHTKLHDVPLPIQELNESCPIETLTAISTTALNTQNTSIVSTDSVRGHGTPSVEVQRHVLTKNHTKLTRNSSSASKRSSGYVSACISDDGDDDDDDDDYMRYYQEHRHLLSPITSPSSTFGSRSSLQDGYITAEEYDESGRIIEMQQNSPSPDCANIYSPPQKGIQKIEGDMEITVKSLQRTVDNSTFSQVYQSYPFPSFHSEQGIRFQIHLYPISLRSQSSCAVYLVVLGWPSAQTVLPKFEINVSVVKKTSKGKCLTLRSERMEVDVMSDALPPTPSDVDYVNIALFPSLIPHSDLFQLDNKTIVIKATLEYKPSVL